MGSVLEGIPSLLPVNVGPAFVGAYGQARDQRMKSDTLDFQKAQEVSAIVSKAAQLADTPEKWATTIGVLKNNFPQADLSAFQDFGSRAAVLSQLPIQDQQLAQSKAQAAQAQGNADRTYNLQVQTANRTANAPYTDIGKAEADLKAGRISQSDFDLVKSKGSGFRPLTDPAERAAAGIPAEDSTGYQRGPDGRIYPIGSGGLSGSVDQSQATAIADGIERGDVPPTAIARNSKYNAPVTAKLAARGVNLAEMTTDWTATQRHYAALNSTQQTRLRQNISTVKGTLQTVRDLAEEWNAGGYPILNAANRKLAEQGALGPDANRIVTLLGAQIADVTGEMGSVLMGGNSPTDHAMDLAAKNLSADWSYPTIKAALDQFEKNIAFRENAIAAVGTAGVTNSQYNYDQPPSPASGLAPTATVPGRPPTAGAPPGGGGPPAAVPSVDDLIRKYAP